MADSKDDALKISKEILDVVPEGEAASTAAEGIDLDPAEDADASSGSKRLTKCCPPSGSKRYSVCCPTESRSLRLSTCGC